MNSDNIVKQRFAKQQWARRQVRRMAGSSRSGTVGSVVARLSRFGYAAREESTQKTRQLKRQSKAIKRLPLLFLARMIYVFHFERAEKT
jgi:hypothetical protein